MTKEKLIEKITEFIPSSKAGTDREWADGTQWLTDKLHKSGKRELDFCFKELIVEKEKNKMVVMK